MRLVNVVFAVIHADLAVLVLARAREHQLGTILVVQVEPHVLQAHIPLVLKLHLKGPLLGHVEILVQLHILIVGDDVVVAVQVSSAIVDPVIHQTNVHQVARLVLVLNQRGRGGKELLVQLAHVAVLNKGKINQLLGGQDVLVELHVGEGVLDDTLILAVVENVHQGLVDLEVVEVARKNGVLVVKLVGIDVICQEKIMVLLGDALLQHLHGNVVEHLGGLVLADDAVMLYHFMNVL